MIAVPVIMTQRVGRFDRADGVCAELSVMQSALLISATTGCAVGNTTRQHRMSSLQEAGLTKP